MAERVRTKEEFSDLFFWNFPFPFTKTLLCLWYCRKVILFATILFDIFILRIIASHLMKIQLKRKTASAK